jgi:hypothetical protein
MMVEEGGALARPLDDAAPHGGGEGAIDDRGSEIDH